MIDGKDVTALSPRNREVGMVFQDYALFPHLDVLANVAYGLAVRGTSRKKREALALEILDSVGMSGFTKRRPHELSGGERQRVALARTMATKPRVVLFDEPLSSLDTVLRKHLRAEIRGHQKHFGLTAIYVTHDLEEAMAMADKVAVMDNGSILQCTTPRDLWSMPANEAVARFLGSGPCLPILRYESSEGQQVAITATGRFAVEDKTIRSSRQGLAQFKAIDAKVAKAPDDLSLMAVPKANVFFERTAARPVSHLEARQVRIQDGLGLFSAICVRNDFAGDAVDCLLKVDQKNISLRLAPESAPGPGEQVQFIVKAEKIQIITAG